MKVRKYNRILSITLALSVAGALMAGCEISLPGAPLETAASVDVARYMGRWYEIAKYPVAFEAGCYGVTADYSLREDGTVRVLNTCREEDGTIRNQIEGFAEVSDKTSNSKLTVYFFYPFGAPYWILEVGENYEYAVVGDPSRSFLWILSRTPTLDEETYNGILSRLPTLGYDPNRLEPMVQFPEAVP